MNDQILHNFTSKILNVTQKSKGVNFVDVRNKLQKMMSRDIISFQNRKLLYTQVAEFISSQIRIIDEIESTLNFL